MNTNTTTLPTMLSNQKVFQQSNENCPGVQVSCTANIVGIKRAKASGAIYGECDLYDKMLEETITHTVRANACSQWYII